MSDHCENCDCIREGDVVEHRMNTNVFGIVIGYSGSLVSIRVSPSLTTLHFHEWELRKVEGDEYDGGETAEAQPINDNVIDFTKAVDLRKAKAKGAA